MAKYGGLLAVHTVRTRTLSGLDDALQMAICIWNVPKWKSVGRQYSYLLHWCQSSFATLGKEYKIPGGHQWQQ